MLDPPEEFNGPLTRLVPCMANNQFQHIDCSQDNGIFILTIKDQQIRDWEQSQAIREELVGAVGEAKTPRVVLQMKNVSYLASCGFLPLVSLNAAVQNAGGCIVLCGLCDLVKQVMSETQMLINPHKSRGIFEECETLGDALVKLSTR